MLLHYKGEGFTCDLSATEPLVHGTVENPDWSPALHGGHRSGRIWAPERNTTDGPLRHHRGRGGRADRLLFKVKKQNKTRLSMRPESRWRCLKRGLPQAGLRSLTRTGWGRESERGSGERGREGAFVRREKRISDTVDGLGTGVKTRRGSPPPATLSWTLGVNFPCHVKYIM